jgi:hypothetical protein
MNFDLEKIEESIECTFYTMPGGMTFEEFLDFMYKLGEQNEVGNTDL